jgi:hypothetical protein
MLLSALPTQFIVQILLISMVSSEFFVCKKILSAILQDLSSLHPILSFHIVMVFYVLFCNTILMAVTSAGCCTLIACQCSSTSRHA